MKTVFFLVLFILVVSVAMHRNALESLLFAVALAVGLTPEFLPMITTVTLSMGALQNGAPQSDRKTPRRDRESRQHRPALQRQDRHLDLGRDGARLARSTRSASLPNALYFSAI